MKSRKMRPEYELAAKAVVAVLETQAAHARFHALTVRAFYYAPGTTDRARADHTIATWATLDRKLRDLAEWLVLETDLDVDEEEPAAWSC